MSESDAAEILMALKGIARSLQCLLQIAVMWLGARILGLIE